MTEIDVLIPSYNCGQWIERCINSVLVQTHPARRVLLIDDASTEPGYSDLCENLSSQHGIKLMRNETNEKCPKNLWLGVQRLDTPRDGVIFILDGDDFLPHENVLARISAVYQDPNVWLTYGNYVPHPKNTGQTLASAYPADVVRNRSFRQHNYACFNHPITFRRHLWDRLEEADFKNDHGEWFRGGYDLVIMMPMLEIAAPGHFRFLNETLYAYNAVNPLSDSTANVDLVVESRQILARPKKAQAQG